MSNNRPFTVEDVDKWTYPRERLVDILNGEYDLQEAREDLRGLINYWYNSQPQNNNL
jgi:hypothetical protein